MESKHPCPVLKTLSSFHEYHSLARSVVAVSAGRPGPAVHATTLAPDRSSLTTGHRIASATPPIQNLFPAEQHAAHECASVARSYFRSSQPSLEAVRPTRGLRGSQARCLAKGVPGVRKHRFHPHK